MSIKKPKNPYRCGLVIPGNRMDLIEKYRFADTDILTFDLEDFVAPSEKDNARKNMQRAVEISRDGWADLFLRINNEPECFAKVLEACVLPGVKGIIIPKVETVERMREIEKIIDRLEFERNIPHGTIVTNMLIESTLGYVNMERICANTKRGHSMNVGTEDFSREMGIKMVDGDELVIHNAMMAVVATAYGLVPMGLVGSTLDPKDVDGVKKVIANSVKAGLKGAWTGNADMLPVISKGFSPTKDEYENAKKVVEGFEKAVAHGEGFATVNGKSADLPVAVRAKKVVDRQKEIDAFEAYKRTFTVK